MCSREGAPGRVGDTKRLARGVLGRDEVGRDLREPAVRMSVLERVVCASSRRPREGRTLSFSATVARSATASGKSSTVSSPNGRQTLMIWLRLARRASASSGGRWRRTRASPALGAGVGEEGREGRGSATGGGVGQREGGTDSGRCGRPRRAGGAAGRQSHSRPWVPVGLCGRRLYEEARRAVSERPPVERARRGGRDTH